MKRINHNQGYIGLIMLMVTIAIIAFLMVSQYQTLGIAPEDLEYIQCKYHRWSVCNKHPDKKCGACYANHNYHQKHSI
jgi:hypothetical protein